MHLKKYIQNNEGLSLKPYLCTAGKTTIGYGRNLDSVGISEDEADMLLLNDIQRCFDELTEIFGMDFYDMEHNIQVVLTDMIFNLGKVRFLGFRKMINAVRDGDYDLAAIEILDSKYAKKDVPNRARRNAILMQGDVEI